ncbi:NAD-dependent epimerase/dehydratase family protein [Nocardia sp. NPDC058499]|uniref:NAD-dependent epimerase/dehydratase family protein n=1 Tax=Nocardia sp. NPDC058499 TaxID=3346530 RepID=UPI0036643192
MKLLVLGGTRFLGRAVVSRATAMGIEVTCFRRGTSETGQQQTALIRGDRNNAVDIARLAGSGQWDAVVDTSAYAPDRTQKLAAALEPVAARYIVVSTVAVYRDWPAAPTTETSPTFLCPSDTPAGQAGYGALKSGCEAAVREIFGADRTVVLRPGAILGPHDYLGRLPWWLHRIAHGGRVLAPGHPDREITPVDVHDVAEFAIRCAQGGSGIFNLAGPPNRATMADLLYACRDATGAHAELSWVTDEEWLAGQCLTPWTSLPLWRIERGVWQVDAGRARQSGFTTQPLVDTVAETWDWLASGGADTAMASAGNGISAEVERSLLARWDDLRAATGGQQG